MGTAYIDRIDTLDASEVNGVIRSLTRVVRITGLTNTDYNILYDALADLDVPQQGDILPGIGFEQLVLARRSVKLLPDDPGSVDVTLFYEHLLDGSNQNLFKPQGGILYGKVSCSVQQKQTNFYVPNRGSIPQQPAQLIVLGHTFPKEDPDFPLQYYEQGGEINVMIPQENRKFEGYVDTTAPWFIKDNLIATINTDIWAGRGPTEWMCTDVQYDIVDTTRYNFKFEFQHNPDTWDPTAVFVDSRTSRPPPGLLNAHDADVLSGQLGKLRRPGFMTIPYHKRIAYGYVFGAVLFEGWRQVF